MRITRADGLITVRQAAALCGVKVEAVRHWITRGYWSDFARDRVHEQEGACPSRSRCGCGWQKLPVARREGRIILLEPVEVQKAEHATAVRARRLIVPTPDAEEAA